MSALKFLLLTQRFPPPSRGGSGRYYENIFRRLPPDEVMILTELTKDSSDQGETNGIRFVRRRSYIKAVGHPNSFARKLITLRMMALWAIELIWLCYTHRPDCIYIGQIDPVGALALLAKRLFGVPYIAFVFGEELTKFKQSGPPQRLELRRRVAEKVYRNASKIVTISHFTVAQLIEFGMSRDQIVLAPPGVDVEQFNPDMDIADFRAKLAPGDANILLTIGRLTERKGHAQVISVLPKVLEAVPNLRYVIAGRDLDAGENLRNLAKRLDLEKQVVFLGHINDDDIPKLYCACDVFIMANYELEHNRDTEGFGIVFLEANACGKPVIGGRAGGVPDAIVHGETGLLVDATDLDALSQAIIKLLTDKAHARSLGTKGRKRALEHFGWEMAASTVREAGLAVAYATKGTG